MDIRLRWAATGLTVGGLSWMPVRYMTATAWDHPVLGFTYNNANRLMIPVMVLLLAGVLLLGGGMKPWLSKAARSGLVVLAVGLALQFAGVFVEFVLGQGLQGGTYFLANLGWGLYCLGAFVAVPLGLLLFGLNIIRKRPAGPWFWLLPVLMAVAALGWLPAVGLQQNALAMGLQVFLGLGWVIYGLGLWRVRLTA